METEEKRSINPRWTRKLASNLVLEIESDPGSGKAISLRLVNDDNVVSTTSPELPSTSSSSSSSMFGANRLPTSQQHRFSAASDSGVWSSLQSPIVSTSDDDGATPKSGPAKRPETASHRALYRFCARHSDEIDLEVGDPVSLWHEFDDQWSEGVNLRTGGHGIFPSSLVAAEVHCSEFTPPAKSTELLAPTNFRIKRERYLLDFLGSIEVAEARGDQVLEESIGRVAREQGPVRKMRGLRIPHRCLLEISDIGIRMTDQDEDGSRCRTKPTHDYFFSLVQITYCGCKVDGMGQQQYYFAFITRHPSERTRFACHVFRAPTDSSRDVAEAVGRAFHRLYSRFLEISL